jgi:membrane protease YdiL (CAAX protease family)
LYALAKAGEESERKAILIHPVESVASQRTELMMKTRPVSTSVTSRISTVAGSAVLALGITVVTGGIWSALLLVNLATSPVLPWAVIVMGVLLWLMWQYLDGKWWPRRTSEQRRRSLRARSVPPRVFAWAVSAGIVSIVALAGFWIVLFQLVKIPGNAVPDFSSYPALTVALVLIMASLVGAVTEEAGFRGYLQGALERECGAAGAIAITALVIAPAHALT